MSETRTPHPKALPNHQNAVIPRSKLEDYALNPASTEGRHKARLFKSILGFERSDWERLANAIIDALPYCEAVDLGEASYGKKFRVTMTIVGPNGNNAIVETIWIIRPDTDYPSFVTPRVIRERGEP